MIFCRIHFSGDTILRPEMVVEKLGGWQDPRVDDGPRYRCCSRRGKAPEKATSP